MTKRNYEYREQQRIMVKMLNNERLVEYALKFATAPKSAEFRAACHEIVSRTYTYKGRNVPGLFKSMRRTLMAVRKRMETGSGSNRIDSAVIKSVLSTMGEWPPKPRPTVNRLFRQR